MLWLFVVLFIVVPLAELWAIIAVSDVIGGWPTIGLLLFDSLLGAWLLKRQGRGVLAKVDARLRANQLPTDELVDGVLILFAGALMLTPGFITDAAGFLLLLPFTRAPLRVALKRRFTVRMGRGFQFVSSSTTMGGSMGGQGKSSFGSGTPAGGRVWEAEVIEDDQELPGPEQS
jgi:UPF0716 protein FxsA